MGLTEIIVAAIAFLFGSVLALFKLWRDAKAKTKAAERSANTQKEMRQNEREASELDDTSLADRLNHPRP